MKDHWQTILAVDHDKWAVATYAANVPCADVRCASVADLIGELPYADVYLGGPPCQPHSYAGKRKASKDSRDCGPDFVAALHRGKPRMFLMENVAGLMSSEGGKYAQRLFGAMEVAGYVVEVKVRDAVCYGVPQFRNRCWWWGIREDLYRKGIKHHWPRITHSWPPPHKDPDLFGIRGILHLRTGVTVRQAIGLNGLITQGGLRPDFKRKDRSTDEPSRTIDTSFTAGNRGLYFKPHEIVGIRRIRGSGVVRRDHTIDEPCPTVMAPTGGKSGLMAVAVRRTLDKPCPTISAGSHVGGPEPVNNRIREGFLRRLTPLECLRLQSGPDDFVWPKGITKTAMYRIVGNGWASRMGAVFSDAFAKADPESRTVVDLFGGGGLGAVGWHGRYWSHESAHPREAVSA